jgi:uncharacterized glyoxalase superfamily protein PhnB
MDLKLELVVVPVSDVDRAKAFYAEKAGFTVDLDDRLDDELRVVQLTPPGSSCSISIGSGITEAEPGSVQGLQLVVSDIDAARAELVGRGVDATEVRQFDRETRAMIPAPEAGPRDWGSFVFFSDPDGNRWTLQQYGGRRITNRSVPAATVIPVLAYPDVPEATAWLCDAFGLQVRLRIAGHRAQLVYGDGAVILTQLSGDDPVPAGGHSVHVRVDDADAHHEQAAAAGAAILSPPTDYPYGERQYSAEDPAGHRWTFSQSVADVDPADWGGTLVDPKAGEKREER